MTFMKFITKPSIHMSTEEIVEYRTETNLETSFLFGFLPIVKVKTKQVPMRTTKFAGRVSTMPFIVEGWPFPIGEKQREVTIEGQTLLGVFAVKEQGQNQYLCYFDAFK